MEVDKVRKETMIIDVAIPGDITVCNKEQKKIEKHSLLKGEIVRLWQKIEKYRKYRKDLKIQLAKRQNCQIMANKKGCCNSRYSWNIRN